MATSPSKDLNEWVILAVHRFQELFSLQDWKIAASHNLEEQQFYKDDNSIGGAADCDPSYLNAIIYLPEVFEVSQDNFDILLHELFEVLLSPLTVALEKVSDSAALLTAFEFDQLAAYILESTKEQSIQRLVRGLAVVLYDTLVG